MSKAEFDTRSKIRTAALELFIAQGFEKTSLREIAERLNLTKAALYYYFPSKGELARAVIEPMKTEVDAMLDDAEAKGDVTPRELFERFFDNLHAHQPEFRAILRDASVLRAVDMESWAMEWIARTQKLLLGPTPTPEQQVRALVAIGGLARAAILALTLPVDVVRKAGVDAACGALGFE